tara:strand:+ start:377 stop:721 length:345 start_codon:yes stop_codon:yes gene_type:complete
MYSSWAALLFLYIQEFPTQSGTVAVWLLRICITSVPLLVIYYLGVFTWGWYKDYRIRKAITGLWGTPEAQIEKLKQKVRDLEEQRDSARAWTLEEPQRPRKDRYCPNMNPEGVK